MNLWTDLLHRADRSPDAPAWVEAGTACSYEQLRAQVVSLAGLLKEQGLGRGDRVAILSENSPFFLQAYFAAAALGAVLVPLNTRLHADELVGCLADSGSSLLLASERLRAPGEEVLERTDGLRAILLEDEPRAEGAPRTWPNVGRDDPAQLYYTSGTTGRPKGVILTHANVGSHARNAVRELGLGQQDRWGHIAPMFHLADAWASFAITLAGGTHLFCRSFEPQAVFSLIADEGMTITNLVPTMLARLVRSPRADDTRMDSMRMILSGGASIAPSLVREVLRVFRCEYVQTYGMTETSPYLTLGLLDGEIRSLSESEVLAYRCRTGRAFRGIELEVVDERGERVPADDETVGEIRVRGGSVSPGYWRRPEETAQVFRDGWLYTGDLAVIEPRGYVNIVDRRKDMILSGGENVYST